MKTTELICQESGIRLDAFLSVKIENKSRSFLAGLCDAGAVAVNGMPAAKKLKLKDGDVVRVDIPEPRPLQVEAQDIPVRIIFEDDHIVVVDKPKGLVVHPAPGNEDGTLVNALLHACQGTLSDINGVIRPGIVHRIDKDTSGILVVAKTNQAHAALTAVFKDHSIRRVYEAVVEGILREEVGRVEAPVGRHPVDRKKMAVNNKNGRRAVTHFRVIERYEKATRVELTLETGRTHQIRVHMAYIGHPVVGDEVYGKPRRELSTGGQVLHARVLGLNHPVTGEYLEFESELPEYFQKVKDFFSHVKEQA